MSAAVNRLDGGDVLAETAPSFDLPSQLDQLERYRHWATTPLKVDPVLSVVIPAYNETQRILPTIGAVVSHVCSLEPSWELIISDDGSSDGTRRIVRELGLVNLKVVETPTNTGKGGAVRRGVQAARGEFILFADADQATPIEQLELLLGPVKTGEADIAVGSRRAGGADVRGRSLGRRILSDGLRRLVKLGFGLSHGDTQCGFKLFSRDAAERLFAVQRIDGFSFDLELLYIASRVGLRVVDVPVRWFDSPGSTVNGGRDTLLFLVDLGRIRLNEALGRYRDPGHGRRNQEGT
ncbi:MAG: glycosyltransferase family 2 protein [Acidimicrobiia bacterium]|nr:glycosyltransferase family 2 protein [Acidimicrobiia bacterium]